MKRKKKMKIEFKKAEQRLSFIKMGYNRDSLINDNDIILLIGEQIREKII